MVAQLKIVINGKVINKNIYCVIMKNNGLSEKLWLCVKLINISLIFLGFKKVNYGYISLMARF